MAAEAAPGPIVRNAELKCIESAADGFRFTVLAQRVGDLDGTTIYLKQNEREEPPIVLSIDEWRLLDAAVETCADAVADGGKKRGKARRKTDAA